MNLGLFNMGTDCLRKQFLVSWLSLCNPNRGFYSLGLDSIDMTKFNVWRIGGAYQQIGFWDGLMFEFFFQHLTDNHYNFSYISNSRNIGQVAWSKHLKSELFTMRCHTAMQFYRLFGINANDV